MSTALTAPLNLSARKRFYEKAILQLLTKMQLGTLNLRLPDGDFVRIGTGEGNITANISIKNPYFFKRCLLYGDIGFGEAYTAGEWDTDNITNVIKWFLLNVENAPSVSGSNMQSAALNILKIYNRIFHLNRHNSLSGSRKNISEHYDLSNDFFKTFLDETLTYSAAYFKEEDMSLKAAQEAKYEHLCQQLHLKPTDHVLEIGSGWGGNAIYMAKNYGCKITTVTISEGQYALAKQRIEEEGLSDKINILLQDYRQLQGSFDKIVSIEMIEAVGAKYLKGYFEKCNQLLKKDGIFAFQVITCPDSRFDELRRGVDWIQKHVFPGSLLPSVAVLNNAVNSTSDFTLVDLKDMGLDYARTLAEWSKQFNSNISAIRQLGFDAYFIRKWNYYLSYCEAAFAARNINVMQMVYARPNNVQR